MASAIVPASSTERAIPLSACLRPSLSSSSRNRARSSARSMASGLVPRIVTPARESERASFSGVCPPNCSTTPIGCSRRTMFSTSSSVNRSEEHTSELQSRQYLVCRLLLEKKKKTNKSHPAKQKRLSSHLSTIYTQISSRNNPHNDSASRTTPRNSISYAELAASVLDWKST